MKLDAEYFRSILDFMPEGIFSVDKAFRIVYFNPAASAITGITRDDAVGRPCREVVRSSFCEGSCPLEEAMGDHPSPVSRDGYLIDFSGIKRGISITAAALEGPDGSPVGGIEMLRVLSVDTKRKGEYSGKEILSVNHKMRRIFDILPVVSESASTVLITGETGTGKEILARSIHRLSPRSDGPFVSINCGALPDTLLESELFGYKAGAFTDAKKDKPGRFELARQGTIFLDEIGDVSAALQVRLLRVLQERIFEPLGSVEGVKADVRVIAATNRDLARLIETGEFRKDLYYRLNIIHFDLPPLRKRAEDIPLLADHFVSRFNDEQDKDIAGIDQAAMGALLVYGFPGNIRELENIIERAFVLCRTGSIGLKHLPEDIRRSGPNQAGDDKNVQDSTSLRAMERSLILDALKRNNGNKAQTARQLGIHKSTLYRKLKPPFD